MRNITFLSNKILISLICVSLSALMGFWGFEGYSNLKLSSKAYSADLLDTIDQRMGSLFWKIKNFPRTASNDILFLSRLSSVHELINVETVEERKRTKQNLENDFLQFIEENSAYYQLRYIDEAGHEVVRVDFDEAGYEITPEGGSQNKGMRYYFEQISQLDNHEVYISPLDLNIEDGELENRGDEANPEYVPVVRYGTPIFNSVGERKGIIISNIYVDYFLEEIRRFQRAGEKAFLINKDGYYLAHPEQDKEFAFMFGAEDNFYLDYPEIERENLSDFTKRRIEVGELIFSFRHVYPTVGAFEIYEGSKKTIGNHSDNDYYWILVSVSDKEEVKKIPDQMKSDYLLEMAISLFIIALIIFSVFLIILKNSHHVPKR